MRRSQAFLAASLLLLASAAAAQALAVPEPSEKAMSYYYPGNVLWAIGLAEHFRK